MTMRILKAAIAGSMFTIQLFSQSLSWGPQYGISRSQDADKSSCIIGGLVRLKPLDEIGLEFALNYHQEKYFDEALKVKAWPIQFSGMVYPVPSLYGTAGVSLYNVTYDFKSAMINDVTELQPSYHVGIGVEFPLEYTTTMAFDIRYVFLDYNYGNNLLGAKIIKSNFYAFSIALLFSSED